MADVTDTLSAAGASAKTLVPKEGDSLELGTGNFNVSASGTFVATIQLERRFTEQGGTVWHPLTAAGSQIGVWTAPFSETFQEPQKGVEYRLNVTSYTSGTINTRMGADNF